MLCPTLQGRDHQVWFLHNEVLSVEPQSVVVPTVPLAHTEEHGQRFQKLMVEDESFGLYVCRDGVYAE